MNNYDMSSTFETVLSTCDRQLGWTRSVTRRQVSDILTNGPLRTPRDPRAADLSLLVHSSHVSCVLCQAGVTAVRLAVA